MLLSVSKYLQATDVTHKQTNKQTNKTKQTNKEKYFLQKPSELSGNDCDAPMLLDMDTYVLSPAVSAQQSWPTRGDCTTPLRHHQETGTRIQTRALVTEEK